MGMQSPKQFPSPAPIGMGSFPNDNLNPYAPIPTLSSQGFAPLLLPDTPAVASPNSVPNAAKTNPFASGGGGRIPQFGYVDNPKPMTIRS